MNLERLEKVFRSCSNMIRAAFIFGSRIEGRAGPLSDYDFAVLPKPDYERGRKKLKLISELLPRLTRELGVDEDKVDIVFLVEPLPEELWYRATVRGIPLYVESEDLLTDLRLRGLRFLDFQVHVKKLRLKELALRGVER